MIEHLIAHNLARDIRERYGIPTAINHRGSIVISESDAAELHRLVWADRRIDAVGRGYYLGAVPIITAPDWTMDPGTVALARLYVLVLYRPLKPVVRWLAKVIR